MLDRSVLFLEQELPLGLDDYLVLIAVRLAVLAEGLRTALEVLELDLLLLMLQVFRTQLSRFVLKRVAEAQNLFGCVG